MSTAASLQNLAAKPKALSSLAHTGLSLQRKCACGSPTSSLTGECAECKGGKRLQTKLAIGASNDPLEREADRVADQVLAAPANPSVGAAAPKIQRDSRDSDAAAQDAPASVDRALASSGSPLDAPLRHDMEQRFGHDFSRVRIHADSAAQQSARDVSAKAYTAGQDIAFGAGQFAPATSAGRHLLAHELTHVVQQGAATGTVRREVDLKDFEAPTEFSDGELDDYLSKFGPDNIEDSSDSDDKARTIVWRILYGGKKRQPPTADKLILMIREMQSGFTVNDDERAILNILVSSEKGVAGWPRLAELFAPGTGLDPKKLDSDFHGAEEDDLRALYDRNFEGGSKAALEGSRKLRSATSEATAKPSEEGKAGDTAPVDAIAEKTPGPECGNPIDWVADSPVPVSITASSVVDFSSQLDFALKGNPHMQSVVNLNPNPTLNSKGRVTAIRLQLRTTIIRPRFVVGHKTPERDRALIARAVEAIKVHEEKHRDASRAAMQKAVCDSIGKTVAQADLIIKKAQCDLEPKEQEKIDAQEGIIEWVKDGTGAITDFKLVGIKQNYHVCK